MRQDGYFTLALAVHLLVGLLVTPTAKFSVQAFGPVLPRAKTSPSPPSVFATGSGDEKKSGIGGLIEGVGNFFQDLDDFLDDASARRLGNGAGRY